MMIMKKDHQNRAMKRKEKAKAMSQSINKIELLGHVGIDPEMRFTQNQTPVVNFTLATSYRPQNGPERTDWHRITAWGAQAEAVAKYVKQGHRVLVHGRLNYSKWVDQNGAERVSAEVTADPFGGVIFLEPRPQNGNGNGNTNRNANRQVMNQAQPEADAMVDDGDMPF